MQAVQPLTRPKVAVNPTDGLCLLIIPQDDELSDSLATDTARRLIALGASLYCLKGGSSVLALTRPAGAFAKAVSLNVFFPENSYTEDELCC